MTDDPRIPFPALPASKPERCGLVGEHPDMQRVYRLISVAAPTLASVLILGAPGTGRTSVAKCIHQNSILSEGPWLDVHLGALSPKEAEDALFGEEHEAGGGDIATRPSQLDQARGGTLFLEDIASLSLSAQARLVTALHAPQLERRRHGDARATEFRIIASSDRDLRAAMAEGAFREDLYFLLAVVTIPIPALGARGDDLLLLLAHFVHQHARASERGAPLLTGIATSALRSLEAHMWSSHVSELQALVSEVLPRATGATIRFEDLPAAFRHDPRDVAAASKSHPSLSELEAEHIALVLRDTHGMIHRAANILGVHRNTLTRKIRQYGLDVRGDA